MGFETKEVLLGCFVYSNFNDISAHPGQWKKLTKYKSVHLRIHITFSTAPEKMRTSLSLFIFAHTTFIYLKRRMIFLFNVGLSPSKKKNYYILQWEPFQNDEKRFLFYLKSSLCSQDFEVFVLTFRPCRKNGFIRKKKVNFEIDDVPAWLAINYNTYIIVQYLPN